MKMVAGFWKSSRSGETGGVCICALVKKEKRKKRIPINFYLQNLVEVPKGM